MCEALLNEMSGGLILDLQKLHARRHHEAE